MGVKKLLQGQYYSLKTNGMKATCLVTLVMKPTRHKYYSNGLTSF